MREEVESSIPRWLRRLARKHLPTLIDALRDAAIEEVERIFGDNDEALRRFGRSPVKATFYADDIADTIEDQRLDDLVVGVPGWLMFFLSPLLTKLTRAVVNAVLNYLHGQLQVT